MDTVNAVEQQIQAEIERLRGQFPQTQDLYREACVLLFFRFGITPTANKLYQFVRKGSMSAPAAALSKFWEDLREKSRVRIECPDLPDEIKVAAGELTATLWARAQALAEESLATYRHEAQGVVNEAKSALATAELDRVNARRELDSVKESLSEMNDQSRGLEQRIAAEGATRTALEAQVRQSGQEITRLQFAQEEARREFAGELDKLRAAAQLAEERFRASEERALLEIDRERTTTTRLQKELEQARTVAGQVAERHRAEIAVLQTDLGQFRQQNGVLEGSLQAAMAGRVGIAAELETARAQLTEAISHAAGLRVEADNWRQKADSAQHAIANLQAKAGRRGRK